MDWQNESYVRLYTKDTPTWRRLKWEGQAVLALLLRKIDQSGVMDGVEDVYDDVSIATGMDIDDVKTGLDLLLKYKVFKFNDNTLFMPNFLEAQTASKSDKQRQKESRDNRKAKASLITNSDNVSQNVTSESQNVTKCHTSSQPVTSGHSLHCNALHDITLPCNTLLKKKPSVKALELSQYLFDKMLTNNPSAKKPNFDSWGKHVDLMFTRDNRTEEQIRYLIGFSQKDHFWSQNILSTQKLRKQFDALAIKVKQGERPKEKKFLTQAEKNQIALDKMQREIDEDERIDNEKSSAQSKPVIHGELE